MTSTFLFRAYFGCFGRLLIINFKKSMRYNPFAYLRSEKDIFISCILRLLWAAVHGKPFRLCQQHVILKYRKGIEYGSARWGTAEDIKPYTDPVFLRILAFYIDNQPDKDSRPKQPKYARNKNILVIGGSGSGKTRFFVKP